MRADHEPPRALAFRDDLAAAALGLGDEHVAVARALELFPRLGERRHNLGTVGLRSAATTEADFNFDVAAEICCRQRDDAEIAHPVMDQDSLPR